MVVSIPNKTIAIWRLDPLLFETVVPKMTKCLNIISYFYHVFVITTFFHSQCDLYKHDTYRYRLLKSLPCRHPSPRLKLDRNLFILWHNNTTSILGQQFSTKNKVAFYLDIFCPCIHRNISKSVCVQA